MKIKKIILTAILLMIAFNSNAQVDYKSFKGDIVKVNLGLNLQNVFFKEYGNERFNRFEDTILANKKIDLNTPENTLTSYYSVSNKENYKTIFKGDLIKISGSELKNRKKSDTLQSTIRFIHRLTFDYQNKPITFFKYKLIKDSIISAPKLLVMEKQIDNSWKIVVNNSFESTKYAVKHIKSKSFWQFISNHNDAKYPEINKLKLQVQDSKGVLDIEKLGEALKNNQSSLKKYLDN